MSVRSRGGGRKEAAEQAHKHKEAKEAKAEKKPLETYVKEQAELAHYEVRPLDPN